MVIDKEDLQEFRETLAPLKKKAIQIGAIPFLLVVLLCGLANLRGCVGPAWNAETEPALYATSDGSRRVWLLPDQELLFETLRPAAAGGGREPLEQVLVSVGTRTRANPAIGPIWFLGKEPWHLRIYAGGAEPWTFPMDVRTAWRAEPGRSEHPQPGGTETLLVLVKPDALRVRGIWYTKAAITEADRKGLEAAKARKPQ